MKSKGKCLLYLIAIAYIIITIGGIGIFANPEETSYANGSLDSINDYIAGQVTIITRSVQGDTVLNTIYKASEYFLKVDGGKDYNMFGILVCQPAEDGYYRVISTNFALSREVEGGMKGDVVIPEDGLIFGVSGMGPTESLLTELSSKVVVGDYIKFDGLDLKEAEGKDSPIYSSTATYSLYHATAGTDLPDVTEEPTPEEPTTEEPTEAPKTEDTKTEAPKTEDGEKNNNLTWIIIGGVLVVVVVVVIVVVSKKKK